MVETHRPEGSLARELRSLGYNCVGVVRAAWASPERKRMQQEIGEGLADLAETVRQEVHVFRGSPTGQRIRSDVEDLRQRVRSGEAEGRVRSKLLGVLHGLNGRLEKTAQRWNRAGETTPPGEEG